MIPEGSKKIELELFMIAELVHEDHLLRKIDRFIKFSFINEICAQYYSKDTGRPAVEAEILFKMLFLGYLYRIHSERRLVELVEEVKFNIAYRWFLGYTLKDKIPECKRDQAESQKKISQYRYSLADL